MAYADVNAVYALNSYLRKALRVNLDWTPPTYTHPVTEETVTSQMVVPSAMIDELMSLNKTFLVYGSAVRPNRGTPQLNSELVVYTVWSLSSTEANKVANFIVDLFQDHTESANHVNAWLDAEQTAREKDRSISFGAIKATVAEKAEPAEQEGGWVAATVSVDLLYTKKNAKVIHYGDPAFTYP